MSELATIARPEVAEGEMDRTTYIGSSDIAAIMGLSPWRTPYDVWESKKGICAEFSPEKQTRLNRGKRFEPHILDMYQDETGAWIVNRNLRYIDPEYPFLAAEIDAEEQDEDTEEIVNLEIKSVSAFAAKNFGEPGTDEFPVYYAAQTMFGLMVTGRRKAKLIALIGTDDQRVYNIDRDDELIAYMRKTAVDFWFNYVVADVPPPPMNKEDALRMLSKFSGVTVVADATVREALDALKNAKATIKAGEKAAQAAEIVITTHIALATEGEPDKFQVVDESGAPLVTWNVQHRKGFTVAPTSFRVLRIKEK